MRITLNWRSLPIVPVVLALTAASLMAAGDQSFGAGVKLTEATPIAALYEKPDTFVGKTIRIDGIVTSVCEEMGCWMALAAKKDGDETVRIKVDDGGGIVFPIKARGKKASAEGVFERMAAGDTHSMEAAKEQAAQTKPADFGGRYQIKATGAIVR